MTHPNRDLALPWLLPYFVYVGVASLPGDWIGRELNYALRILLTAVVLAWGRRTYPPLRGPRPALGSVLWGALAGLLGLGLWILLVHPFVVPGGEPWDPAAFVLRLLAAGLLVPVFEELALRGFVLRFLHQWEQARRSGARDALAEALDRNSVRDFVPGAASLAAVLGSSVLFALGHAPPEMVAAFAYGLLMAGLWIVRKDLLACIVAHAVTNVALAAYVRSTGDWALW